MTLTPMASTALVRARAVRPDPVPREPVARRRVRIALALWIGLYPIVTLEKQLLNMIGNLV